MGSSVSFRPQTEESGWPHFGLAHLLARCLEFGSVGCVTWVPRRGGTGGGDMQQTFIPLSVVFVTSLLSLAYGVRYLIPALVVAGLASYELHRGT